MVGIGAVCRDWEGGFVLGGRKCCTGGRGCLDACLKTALAPAVVCCLLCPAFDTRECGGKFVLLPKKFGKRGGVFRILMPTAPTRIKLSPALLVGASASFTGRATCITENRPRTCRRLLLVGLGRVKANGRG